MGRRGNWREIKRIPRWKKKERNNRDVTERMMVGGGGGRSGEQLGPRIKPTL